jgi:hypothetical protein
MDTKSDLSVQRNGEDQSGGIHRDKKGVIPRMPATAPIDNKKPGRPSCHGMNQVMREPAIPSRLHPEGLRPRHNATDAPKIIRTARRALGGQPTIDA